MSGQHHRMTAADGFESSVYIARPSGPPRGGVVILPEIFGVNAHIRAVTDRYASRGYLAVAPSVFDRVQRDLDLGYDDDAVRQGQALMREIHWDRAVMDIEAAGAVASRPRAGSPVRARSTDGRSRRPGCAVPPTPS